MLTQLNFSNDEQTLSNLLEDAGLAGDDCIELFRGVLETLWPLLNAYVALKHVQQPIFRVPAVNMSKTTSVIQPESLVTFVHHNGKENSENA